MRKLIYILLFIPLLSMGQVPAFPSAEGFGKYTTGGKGGSVVFVTNLNNSGSGSLRNALEASGARTVIFRTGGTVNLTSPITISNDNITIAGETAPGGGILVKGAGININASNVIIRHIRIRVGADGDLGDAMRIVTFGSKAINNVIIDHCSLSWAEDENFSVVSEPSGPNITNVTLQNSIISESFSYAVLIMYGVSNTSFYKNLLAHNNDRQFHSSVCGSEYEIINNLIYNYKRGTELTYEGKYDVIGNTYKSNVAPDTYAMRYQTNPTNCPDGNPALGEIYQTDNTTTGSAYSLTHPDWSTYDAGSRVISGSLITPLARSTVEGVLLDDVGAYPNNRDAVDTRIVSDYENTTGGLITDEDSVGGFPTISAGTAYTDTDSDGMDDSWETTEFGNLSKGNNGNDLDAYYTNLQMFLFYMAGDEGGSTPSPTCSDGIQNGDETGIDCGGSCSPCGGIELGTGAGARAFMNYLLTN